MEHDQGGPEKPSRKWTLAEQIVGLPETVDDAWQSPRHPNVFTGPSTFGSVAAPFLAGFAFTAIPLLIALENPPPLTEGAIFFFVVATVGFLYSLQFSAWMQSFVSPPSVRLDWRREAVSDEGAYLKERKQHAADLRIAAAYLTRVAWSFDTALLAFLSGIVLLLVPHEWSAWRIASMVPVGAALLFEAYSYLGSRLLKGRLPDFWSPDHEGIVASIDLEEPSATSRAAAGFPGPKQPD